MELLVCIKQVPDDSVSVGLNADGTPKLDEITPVVNAFDTYALEMAARFKEAPWRFRHGSDRGRRGCGPRPAQLPGCGCGSGLPSC